MQTINCEKITADGFEGVGRLAILLRRRGRVAGCIDLAGVTLRPGPGDIIAHVGPVHGAGGPGIHPSDTGVAGVQCVEDLLAEVDRDERPVMKQDDTTNRNETVAVGIIYPEVWWPQFFIFWSTSGDEGM